MSVVSQNCRANTNECCIRFNRTGSISRGMARIRQEMVTLDIGIVFKSITYFLLCIIDDILIAIGTIY